jgi:hypothetical protein
LIEQGVVKRNEPAVAADAVAPAALAAPPKAAGKEGKAK